MKFLLWLIPILSLLVSCQNIEFGKQPEGMIEYDVIYLNNQSNIPTNVLPNKVTLKFKNSKSVTTIEGFMGMFSLSTLTDNRKSTNTVVLRVMDKRYYHVAEKGELPFFFDGLEGMDVLLTDDTKRIAGYNCKKAIITFPDSTRNPYEVYYSNEIKIRNPNKTNPYHKINGVLMQFVIRISNMELLLTATKYNNQKLQSDVFTLPDNYKRISKEKMELLMAKLME